MAITCLLTTVLLLVPLCGASIGYRHFEPGTVVFWTFTGPSTGNAQLKLAGSSDIALQINVHFSGHHTGEQIVTLHSRINGEWGAPEWCDGFPFQSGQQNDVIVVTSEDGFDIYSDLGNFQCKCNKKMQHSSIQHIYNSTGTVQIGMVVQNFSPGRVIYIEGTLANPQEVLGVLIIFSPSSSYNFKGTDRPPLRDIALNVRFNQNHDSCYISRNSYSNDAWGRQECDGEKLYEKGSPFILAVTCQLYGYEIAVNGKHFATYKHRLPIPEQMTVLARPIIPKRISYY